MADELRKKRINRWDGGIQTHSRDSDTETSFGAQEVKHFDVYNDSKKLTPMPDWIDFNKQSERLYNIRAMGGFSDTVYGIGTGLGNWYSSSWSHRVRLETNASVTAGSMPYMFDLSVLGDDFWDNIQSDGADLRGTTSDGVTGIPIYVENIDIANKTGQMWVSSLQSKDADMFLYWGNSTVSAIPSSTFTGYQNQPINVWGTGSLDWAYTFANDVINRSVGNTSTDEFQTTPTFVEGLFGKAIETPGNQIETDDDDETALSGNDISVSFMIYLYNLPSTDRTVVSDSNGTWHIQVKNTGAIDWFVNGTAGNTEVTSSATLSANQWYVIDCVFDDDHYIYIDAVEDLTTTNDGSYDDNVSNNKLVVQTLDGGPSFCKIAQLQGRDNDLTQDQITAKYENFTDNANFWTVSSIEAYSAFNPTWSGIQMYSKNISSGDWAEYVISGQPVKSLNAFPVNGFVESVGGDWYFISSQEENDGGFLFLAKSDTFTIIDESHLLLNTISASVKIVPTSDSPVDTSVYFTHYSSGLGEVGDPGASSVFGANSQIESIVPWRETLALVSNRRNRGLLEIWDLNATNPTDVADCGTGTARIVGNAEDILFTVVDNFIDDVTKSSGSPKVQLKQYVGNGRMKTILTKEIPANITTYSDNWERAVSNMSFRREDVTLFYAKLPTNAEGTTFDEGFWAVGLNSKRELAMTLMLDTSDIGSQPEQVHSFAQQVFFIEKDGNIKQLSTSGSYTKVSSYKTLKMNEGNTEIEKKLYGVELITEPLEANQEVTLYYKTDTDSERVKIGTFTGEGKITVEYTHNGEDVNLPSYKEIEFTIESTKGKSAILEFNYLYEYLSDVV